MNLIKINVMMPNTVRALTLTDEQFRERRVMNKQKKIKFYD